MKNDLQRFMWIQVAVQSYPSCFDSCWQWTSRSRKVNTGMKRKRCRWWHEPNMIPWDWQNHACTKVRHSSRVAFSVCDKAIEVEYSWPTAVTGHQRNWLCGCTSECFILINCVIRHYGRSVRALTCTQTVWVWASSEIIAAFGFWEIVIVDSKFLKHYSKAKGWARCRSKFLI